MHMPRIAPMRARRTLSVTDFRKNPSRHMADAMGDTLAEIVRNNGEFYPVPPAISEALLERREAQEGGAESRLYVRDSPALLRYGWRGLSLTLAALICPRPYALS